MKKAAIILLALCSYTAVKAQDTTGKARHKHYDAELPSWCIDINLQGGMLNRDLTTLNMADNYLNHLSNASVGEVKFANGMSYGFDAQLGYFFGKKKHFGVGVGFMYLMQSGDLSMDKFHMEYQSTDYRNETFRQLLTANGPIKETQKMTNMNIPVVLKYKNQFSKKWGFTADAGILVNMQMKTTYSTDASFDYEAIYKYALVNNKPTAVYDNSLSPEGGDWLMTKAYYTTKNPNGVADTFNGFRKQGYNVGLGAKPDNNSGDVSATNTSIGFMIQPSLSYLIGKHVALSLGAYYTYQSFNNDKANSNYMLTNKVGSYSSLENSVKTSNNSSYGVNLGLRIYLERAKDSDHDGVPDKKDLCPDVKGLKMFHGCPDSDGDSVIDKDDLCPNVKGLVKFHGCPDTDGDGIPDNEDGCPNEPGLAINHGCPDKDGDGVIDRDDACPDVRGLVSLHGCPDADGDGIADKDDACPDKAGPARFHGCPDTDGDGIPDNQDKCPEVAGVASNNGCPAEKVKTEMMLDMIQFNSGTANIAKQSYAIINAAIEKLNSDPEAVLSLDGYTDDKGSAKANHKLSVARALSVKKYMLKKGIKADRLITNGHSSEDPIAPNTTKDGRAKNRRVVLNLKYNKN